MRCAHAVGAWRIDNPTLGAAAARARRQVAAECARIRASAPASADRAKRTAEGCMTHEWARRLLEADGLELNGDAYEVLLLHGLSRPL